MVRLERGIITYNRVLFKTGLEHLSNKFYLADPETYRKGKTKQKIKYQQMKVSDEFYFDSEHELHVTSQTSKSFRCLLGQNNKDGFIPECYNIKQIIDARCPSPYREVLKEVYDEVVG